MYWQPRPTVRHLAASHTKTPDRLPKGFPCLPEGLSDRGTQTVQPSACHPPPPPLTSSCSRLLLMPLRSSCFSITLAFCAYESATSLWGKKEAPLGQQSHQRGATETSGEVYTPQIMKLLLKWQDSAPFQLFSFSIIRESQVSTETTFK